MICCRHQSSRPYNLEQAQIIARDVIDRLHGVFGDLKDHFAALTRADSMFYQGSDSGRRRAITNSAVMSCITACNPDRID